VLVGSTYPWPIDAPPLQGLGALPNVFFLGRHPYEDMPHLLDGMDVCLMPYVNDERGRYRSPLKLYEYLAAGKPVVSTAHPEAQEFAELVYVASAGEGFCSEVARALQEDQPARQSELVKLARAHSWDRRVDKMENLIWRHWPQER
jgi:glycosyltransferase involved in cell wall biosynthesis